MLLLYLTYVGTIFVALSAVVRSANIKGFQWWAYIGYTINSLFVILYSLHIGEHSILLNQSLLMITNAIGLFRWWGK